MVGGQRRTQSQLKGMVWRSMSVWERTGPPLEGVMPVARFTATPPVTEPGVFH